MLKPDVPSFVRVLRTRAWLPVVLLIVCGRGGFMTTPALANHPVLVEGEGCAAVPRGDAIRYALALFEGRREDGGLLVAQYLSSEDGVFLVRAEFNKVGSIHEEGRDGAFANGQGEVTFADGSVGKRIPVTVDVRPTTIAITLGLRGGEVGGADLDVLVGGNTITPSDAVDPTAAWVGVGTGVERTTGDIVQWAASALVFDPERRSKEAEGEARGRFVIAMDGIAVDAVVEGAQVEFARRDDPREATLLGTGSIVNSDGEVCIAEIGFSVEEEEDGTGKAAIVAPRCGVHLQYSCGDKFFRWVQDGVIK